MPIPPPPPPPPPPASGGPPPPPPLPGGGPKGSNNLLSRPPAAKGRGALLGDISKGAKLKKVEVVNDRSAPQVGKVSNGPPSLPVGGAPPVPGLPKVTGGSTSSNAGNRLRSSSDVGQRGADSSTASAAPQLGGIFAGGIPKLRRSGGVNTGADKASPYLSDSESTKSSAPRPPTVSANNSLGAPKLPRAAPPQPPSSSAQRNGLRPTPLSAAFSSNSATTKAKPPLPVGKKPAIPPPASRKPSIAAPPVPSAPAPPPAPAVTPSAPPPPAPPQSSTLRPLSPPRTSSTRTTPPPPPPPPSSIAPLTPPRVPSARTTPPPPPPSQLPNVSGTSSSSLAEQAARNAFGRTEPAAPPSILPTSPPPPSAPPPPPSVPSAPPPPPSAIPSIISVAPPLPDQTLAKSRSQTPLGDRQPVAMSALDPSAYTLTNGNSSEKPSRKTSLSGLGGIVRIQDSRWKFQDESQLPKPREFTGSPKLYRAGRGSSVPLNLSALE